MGYQHAVREKGKCSRSAEQRRSKVQMAVEAAGNSGLSRLSVHMVERGTLARLDGESAEHWTRRQFRKQHDEAGRRRVANAIDEIQNAGHWPWS